MQQRGMAIFLAALKATLMSRKQIGSEWAIIPLPHFSFGPQFWPSVSTSDEMKYKACYLM